MSSIKVKFRPSAEADREGNVYYIISHERTVRQVDSVCKLHPAEWDDEESMPIVSRDPKQKSRLARIRERIKVDLRLFRRAEAELVAEGDPFTAADLAEVLVRRMREQSFFNFMESVTDRLRELGKHRTAETYATALRSFRIFRREEDVALEMVNSALMENYESHLREQGLVPNSISFYMRILRAVYNRAVDKGITEDRKPFRHVYTGVDRTSKRAINLRTLRKIKQADLESHPGVDYARDMFMLSFFLRGMSFVDMAYLKKTNLSNGRVTYRRRKTGQQLVIKWTQEMQKILNKYPENTTDYLLPIITESETDDLAQYRHRQNQINRYLKVLAKRVGLKMSLTLYCSRHSWASIAKAKGIPVGVISDGLGHDSELTTQIYLSTLDTHAVDRANAMIMRLL